MKLEKQTFTVSFSFDPRSCSKFKCVMLSNHMTRKYQGFKTKIKKVCQMGKQSENTDLKQYCQETSFFNHFLD